MIDIGYLRAVFTKKKAEQIFKQLSVARDEIRVFQDLPRRDVADVPVSLARGALAPRRRVVLVIESLRGGLESQTVRLSDSEAT